MNSWLLLVFAIILETIATVSLKSTEGFTKIIPTTITILGYLGAFFLLSKVLESIPIGVAYAIWSGVGIILASLISWYLYNQRLDLPAVIGMLLIVLGVLVINLFSNSVTH